MWIFNNLQEKQAPFAKKIGVSQSFLSKVLRGESKPSADMLNGIIKAYPNIEALWLLTGEGPIYRHQPSAVNEDSESYTNLTPRQLALLEMFDSLPETEQEEVMRLARKEKEQADMRQRLEKLERKTA